MDALISNTLNVFIISELQLWIPKRGGQSHYCDTETGLTIPKPPIIIMKVISNYNNVITVNYYGWRASDMLLIAPAPPMSTSMNLSIDHSNHKSFIFAIIHCCCLP